jgi:hypothetical protein
VFGRIRGPFSRQDITTNAGTITLKCVTAIFLLPLSIHKTQPCFILTLWNVTEIAVNNIAYMYMFVTSDRCLDGNTDYLKGFVVLLQPKCGTCLKFTNTSFFHILTSVLFIVFQLLDRRKPLLLTAPVYMP